MFCVIPGPEAPYSQAGVTTASVRGYSLCRSFLVHARLAPASIGFIIAPHLGQ